MVGDHELDLRIAVAEGIISRDEVEALREEARRLERRPLCLLVERGQLSEESLALLVENMPRQGGPSIPDPDATESVLVPPPADPDATATLSPGTRKLGVGAPDFPVADWDRYRPLRFLGQGGMGKVFLARDVRLHRDVAIKFVHGGDRGSLSRLVSEARAQARVSHERVCQVYEVGEVEGEVYIAMQFIDGVPLGTIADRLSTEQKARLLRDAALGLHEAHRQGIVHRDVKPSNIMVVRTEDGDLQPFVMDFGLARSSGGGTTETGAVLGTAHYMSPEQARGEVSRLDRRADVYSLGATLYAVLTGEPPIPGDNALDVVARLATEEPRAPRALDPDIPVDLEVITVKCLEKDRAGRYDSARALAEDLDRFLGGEPVAARPAGAWYRLRKRIVKHRRPVIAGTVAAMLLLAALGWGLSVRKKAAERERLARRFTELVERIESQARYSALSRLHDIRADRAAIRARMEELQAEIRRAGPVAIGPGSYALGRGYLALGEEGKAREALEVAWRNGYREPRAAYALALVMGHLYQESLLEAEKIRSPEQREARRREIEPRYRDPALAYLRQSEGAEVPSREYVAALVGFYEDRLDEALAHVDAIGAGLPWFYEAPQLRGEILLARALRLRNQGKREEARPAFDAGRRALTLAAAVGESVPAIHEELGELEYEAMVMELYGGGDLAPAFARGVEATSRALAVEPEDRASFLVTARLHLSLAEYRVNQGGDAEDLLKKAITAAQRALAVDPARPEAALELGRIYRQWAQLRQGKGQDPREQLRLAAEISESIRAEDRDYAFYQLRGLIFQVWADYEEGIGVDPSPNRGRSIDAYLAASRIDGQLSGVWINLGVALYTRAAGPRPKDPDADLEQARAAFDKAGKIDPRHIVPYYYRSQILVLSASRKRARGEDARPDLEQAVEACRQGSAINAGVAYLHNGRGMALLELATEAWDHGGDPDPVIERARGAFEQAIAVAPQQGLGYNNDGFALARRVHFQRLRGEDPEPTVRTAREVLRKAFDRLPGHPWVWSNLAIANAELGRFELEHGRDPGPSLALASEAVGKVLEHNPRDGLAHFYLGETRGLRARWLDRRGQAANGDFERAAQAYQEALDLTPDDQDYRIAAGHFSLDWAAAQRSAGRDPGPRPSALDLANEVLAVRPAWPDALVLRATATLVQAEGDAHPEDQGTHSSSALADFTRALGANANLERAWAPQLARARRLAAPR
jgi:serine/threonine-protein kinase